MTYDSDITDNDWTLLSPYLVRKKRCGLKSRVDLRKVVNGIFYRIRTGCQWRYLPKDYGDWRVISAYFYRWSRAGIWEQINTELREQCREKAAKYKQPTVAIIDAQSVKTTQKGGSAAMMQAKKPRDANVILQ
jgi:putative transposase